MCSVSKIQIYGIIWFWWVIKVPEIGERCGGEFLRFSSTLMPDFEKEHRQNLAAMSSLKSEELQKILKRMMLYIMGVTCFSLASMLGILTNTMYVRNNFGALVPSPGRNSSSLPTWWEFVQYVLATAPRRSFLWTPRKFQDNFDSLWPTGRMSIGDLCLSIALLAQLVTM